MVKNVIIAILSARTLMSYMIIPPIPAGEILCFAIWWAVSFVLVLMAEDGVEQIKEDS